MRWLLVVLLGLLSLNSYSRVIPEAEYSFPFPDPMVAAIVSNAFLYKDSDYEKLSIEILPERRNVFLFEKRNGFVFTLFEQKNKKAPLAFVLSGTGGTAFSDKSLWLGKQLFALGYHVVTLPNTLNFSYALSVSQTGVPGYTPRDAKEYYQVLKQVVEHLTIRKRIQIEGYSLVGYSLGGLLAGFIQQEDVQHEYFHFSKLVMLNPAIDIGFSIGSLDEYFQSGMKIKPSRREFLMNQILSVGSDLLENGFSIEKILEAIERLKLTLNEKKWIIGNAFRSDLRDVVFVSQQIKDLNVLKTPYDRFNLDNRINEAATISFSDYVNQIVLPSLENKNLPVIEFLKQASIYPLVETLKKHPQFYIFTNADDFIHRKEDIELMASLVPTDRFFLYPHGGHTGNFWFPINRADFSSVMKF